MIVEIKGTGPHNKGAEMMLLTIIQELRKFDSNIKFTITPSLNNGSTYEFYSALSIYPKLWLTYKGIDFSKFGRFIPKKLRQLYGLILDEDIDVVLDASGFAYSDQWGEYPVKEMAKQSENWKKNGTKVILLPQAFGPFENQSIKKNMKKIIENTTLIYARDEYSYKELLKLDNNTKKIQLCPDFTVLFKGELPEYFDVRQHQICIVPNQRIKDKGNDTDNYEEFLIEIIKKLQSSELSPFFLIHGGDEDKVLADFINNKLTTKIEIIDERNPYFIKGIIENSMGLIGSRFHSLASGLYSGIPTLGTGWSHKYEYLFKGFQFEEGLMDINEKDIEEKLKLIISKDERKVVAEKLINSKKEIESKTLDMFSEIFSIMTRK